MNYPYSDLMPPVDALLSPLFFSCINLKNVKKKENQVLEVGCISVPCPIILLFVSITLKVVLTLTSLDK